MWLGAKYAQANLAGIPPRLARQIGLSALSKRGPHKEFNSIIELKFNLKFELKVHSHMEILTQKREIGAYF